MQETAVLRKNHNMVTRLIDDEVVLLPIYKTSDEINCIYTLNRVASRIWELIDGKRTLSQIRSVALKEFDATSQQVNKEMGKLVKELREIKAIK